MSTTNDKIIIPTIGRRVWFWPVRNAGQFGFISHDEGTPMDAGVVYVWGDRMVNLDVTDHAGNHHSFTSVTLMQPGDEPPSDGRYCQWMPYQIGQAKAPVVTATAEQMPKPNAGNMYRKRPVVVEGITFEALVQHGRDFLRSKLQALGEGGMPWSFEYKGHAITHERDDCYMIPTAEGTLQMTPADMLITGLKGEIYPCKIDIFEATYERVTPKPPHGRAEWAARMEEMNAAPLVNAVEKAASLKTRVIELKAKVHDSAVTLSQHELLLDEAQREFHTARREVIDCAGLSDNHGTFE